MKKEKIKIKMKFWPLCLSFQLGSKIFFFFKGKLDLNLGLYLEDFLNICVWVCVCEREKTAYEVGHADFEYRQGRWIRIIRNIMDTEGIL